MANETSDLEEDRADDRAAQAVEEALHAFRDLLTPAETAESRELLVDVLAAHPIGRLLAERVRERKRTLNSCERPIMGAPINGQRSQEIAHANTDLPPERDKVGGSR